MPLAASPLRTLTLGLVLAGASLAAAAQTSVNYGRITAVRATTVENTTANRTGTVVGGALGLASGSGQSGSNRALRATGGAVVGNRVASAASGRQAFEYTVLIGGTTTTVVTEQSGMRVGDCVSVERGAFNNLRLVDESRCRPPARPAAPAAAPAAPAAAAATAPEDLQRAEACNSAKQQVLAANTDEEFDRAERRMRLLCN